MLLLSNLLYIFFFSTKLLSIENKPLLHSLHSNLPINPVQFLTLLCKLHFISRGLEPLARTIPFGIYESDHSGVELRQSHKFFSSYFRYRPSVRLSYFPQLPLSDQSRMWSEDKTGLLWNNRRNGKFCTTFSINQ